MSHGTGSTGTMATVAARAAVADRRHTGQGVATAAGGSMNVRSMGRPAKLALAAGSAAALALSVSTTPALPASAATLTCGGAALPYGFVIENGKPHSIAAPYKDVRLYNPQSLGNFIRSTLGDLRNTTEQQTCLAVLGGSTVLAGATTAGYTDADGLHHDTLLFPYPFAFSANPAAPTLAPGWVSGLAQGSVMDSLALIYDRTNDASWMDAAGQAFESFLLPESDGGFVSHERGLTYIQEYPTKPAGYVLNGHNEAVIALDLWVRRTKDPRAVALLAQVEAALTTTLPLEQVQLPMGAATSYDLLRGYPTARTRVLTSTGLTVRGAAILNDQGQQISRLAIPASRAPVYQRSLLTNGNLSAWRAGLPTGWVARVTSRTPGTFVRTTDGKSAAVRITTSGRSWEALSQDVPAAKVKPNAWYRVSWRAKLERTTNVNSTSGRVGLIALCPGVAPRILAENYAVRGDVFSGFDMLVRTPVAKCGLRVQIYENDWTFKGSKVVFGAVSLSLPQYGSPAVSPAYPLEVLAVRTPRIQVNYTGSGWLQMWLQGRWFTVGTLPHRNTVSTITTILVPGWAQGRNIHLGYHEHHVAELTSLYSRTGSKLFQQTALRWLPLAPATFYLEARLRAPVQAFMVAPLADRVPVADPALNARLTGPVLPGDGPTADPQLIVGSANGG